MRQAQTENRHTEANQARQLAYRIERLAVGGRTDPELIIIEKHTIARELKRMARRLEDMA